MGLNTLDLVCGVAESQVELRCLSPPALEVTQHHFCHTALVGAVTDLPRFEAAWTLPLQGVVRAGGAVGLEFLLANFMRHFETKAKAKHTFLLKHSYRFCFVLFANASKLVQMILGILFSDLNNCSPFLHSL